MVYQGPLTMECRRTRTHRTYWCWTTILTSWSRTSFLARHFHSMTHHRPPAKGLHHRHRHSCDHRIHRVDCGHSPCARQRVIVHRDCVLLHLLGHRLHRMRCHHTCLSHRLARVWFGAGCAHSVWNGCWPSVHSASNGCWPCSASEVNILSVHAARCGQFQTCRAGCTLASSNGFRSCCASAQSGPSLRRTYLRDHLFASHRATGSHLYLPAKT